ncbi:oocyte zinc finger protein XlCOF7.1-like [Ischnura elegans]|uniref:oocyte zinc finger protein XlCOF7.1-like n=1 Tax=Ischnura elegans TaxID=197161 RepID=UPI001ED8A97D|nr:oocyte zinc finger protein XlCOF7.1-like [Ischnura elegans]
MAEILDADKMSSAVCRLCLGKGENYAPIFENLDLPTKMKYCVEVDASPSDGLTSVICLTCLESVEKFYIFKKMCADSQIHLKKTSKDAENSMKVMIVPGSISSGKETAKDSGVDWSTEEGKKPSDSGDPVTSTSAEADEKPEEGPSGKPQQGEPAFYPEQFESEADKAMSEEDESGDWGESAEDHANAQEEEGGEDEEEEGDEEGASAGMAHVNEADGMDGTVVVKQEIMDEEEEDYMMDESYNTTMGDENGEYGEAEEPPWDEAPPMDELPLNMELEEGLPQEPMLGEDTEQGELGEGDRRHVCKFCQQTFVKRHQLYGHLATHSRKGGHSRSPKVAPPPAAPRIKTSPANFSRPPSKIRQWLLDQQKLMKFCCIDCNEEFIGVAPYTSHKGIHRQKDKKFHCSVCNHIYPRAIDLIFHEWTYHTGDRPFPCNKCPSAFARQTSWTYHVLAHISNSHKTPSRNAKNSVSHVPPLVAKPATSQSPVHPVQPSSPKVEEESPTPGRRTMAPRKAALEGRAAAQMGAVVANSLTNFPFRCRTCGKGILNEETWEYHLVIHPDGGETRQNLSPEDLESLRNQLRQAIMCENDTKIACLQCGLECTGLQGLASHKSERHFGKGGYKCNVCFKGVGNVHKFIRHEMSHSKVKIYVCENCGREMADRMSFVRHIIAHFNEPQFGENSGTLMAGHPAAVVPEVQEREDVKDVTFDQVVQRLLGPIKAHLKQELSPCLQCGQVFEGIQRLVVHKEIHSSNTAGSHPHACWVCTEAFETAKALVEHEWSHTDVKPYGCDRCDQKYSSKEAWITHLRSHFPPNSFALSPKGKMEQSMMAPGVKRRMVSEPPPSMTPPPKMSAGYQSPNSAAALRPFACGQCKSIFTTAESLEAHAVQSHGLIHPFKCKICGKGYRLLLRLMHHESSVHPQLMGHACSQCTKSFSDPSHLKLHSHLIHGDGPYKCDVCGKRFRMIGHLKIHRNMHRGKIVGQGSSPYSMGQASTSMTDDVEYGDIDVFD